MRKVVCTNDAPGVGPYSQAVKGGRFIFVSGRLALHPATRQIIDGDARQQTERAPWRISLLVLKAAGSSLDKVVRCGVSLKNIRDFKATNDVYAKIFGPHPPVRTTVEVARLPKDSLVEIDAIAPGWDRCKTFEIGRT
jgi:2-iminobutanoate/2-iminopropanoate deaminase